MIRQTERPLTEEERARLSSRLAGAKRESALALLKTGAAGALVCGALCAATLLASDAPGIVVVGFWTVLWLLFTLWVGLPWRRLMRGQIPVFEEALRSGRARELAVQAAAVVEFEEEEDEGACYAFAHEPDAALFVVGQEFYEDVDFPNDDFSIVEILGEGGRAIDAGVVKRGRKLQPVRVVPAAVKRRLKIPEHLAIVPVPLHGLERALGGDGGRETREPRT